jgi:hypothetical protein
MVNSMKFVPNQTVNKSAEVPWRSLSGIGWMVLFSRRVGLAVFMACAISLFGARGFRFAVMLQQISVAANDGGRRTR